MFFYKNYTNSIIYGEVTNLKYESITEYFATPNVKMDDVIWNERITFLANKQNQDIYITNNIITEYDPSFLVLSYPSNPYTTSGKKFIESCMEICRKCGIAYMVNFYMYPLASLKLMSKHNINLAKIDPDRFKKYLSKNRKPVFSPNYFNANINIKDEVIITSPINVRISKYVKPFNSLKEIDAFVSNEIVKIVDITREKSEASQKITKLEFEKSANEVTINRYLKKNDKINGEIMEIDAAIKQTVASIDILLFFVKNSVYIENPDVQNMDESDFNDLCQSELVKNSDYKSFKEQKNKNLKLMNELNVELSENNAILENLRARNSEINKEIIETNGAILLL